MIKQCTKCLIFKDLIDFNKDNKGKDGLSSRCKLCKSLINQSWYLTNKDDVKSKSLQYYYNPINHNRIINTRKIYQQNNRITINKYKLNWCKNKNINDITFKLKSHFSKILNTNLKSVGRGKQRNSWINFLDYSPNQLKSHLESLFEPWMNWNNYGYGEDKWIIEHIKPICSFAYDSYDHPQFKECWSLNNLRPYCWRKNLLKIKEDKKLSVKKYKKHKIKLELI